MTRLKLALQKDGRMTKGSLALLERCGLDVEFQPRVLLSQCGQFPMDVLAVRDDDIPEYVETGVSDLGIVGENVVRESGADVEILERLGFARCELAIAVPRTSSVSSLKDLENKRIATTYPRTLKQFLSENSIECEIIELTGAVEIAPSLGLADAICDLVSTGTTARLNGLEFLCPVLKSEAVLIANKTMLEKSRKDNLLGQSIENLLLRIRSTGRARKLKYLMMNAPATAVPMIKEWIPGLKSPSVMPLSDPDMVAIHSVVSDDVLWDVVAKLKKVGASDMVALSVDSLIP